MQWRRCKPAMPSGTLIRTGDAGSCRSKLRKRVVNTTHNVLFVEGDPQITHKRGGGIEWCLATPGDCWHQNESNE